MMQVNYDNIEANIEYMHVQRNLPCGVSFHLHTGCEIFFLVSGDVSYFVEKQIYPLNYGDVIITNSEEIHKPAIDQGKPYERITLAFSPALVRPFSSPEFDLLDCFVNRPNGEKNKVTLNQMQLDQLLGLFKKIELLEKDSQKGYEILKMNYLIEILVLLNRAYKDIDHFKEQTNIPDKLLPILHYIDRNLDKDLSLHQIEKQFFFSRFYLSKLFKSSIGSSIHEYIIYKRISKAKRLLSEGMNVTDTCVKCGFHDYSNFLKIFKRTVGVSPGKYVKHTE